MTIPQTNSSKEPRTGRRAVGAGVAVAAAAAGAGWAWWRSQENDSPDRAAVQAFWGLTLQTPEGAAMALQQFSGKPLLVNFWATWCPPCVRELPMLSAFAKSNPQWQLLGLAVDQAPAVQKFLQRQELDFPVLMAGAGGSSLTRSLGNTNGGLPFSILFDGGGNVKQRKIGELNEADLQAWGRAYS